MAEGSRVIDNARSHIYSYPKSLPRGQGRVLWDFRELSGGIGGAKEEQSLKRTGLLDPGGGAKQKGHVSANARTLLALGLVSIDV